MPHRQGGRCSVGAGDQSWVLENRHLSDKYTRKTLKDNGNLNRFINFLDVFLGCCQYTVCSSVPSEAKMRIVGLVRCCPSLPPVWPKADDLMSISWRVALARLSAMVPGTMLTRYLDAWLCSFGWHSYILFLISEMNQCSCDLWYWSRTLHASLASL